MRERENVDVMCTTLPGHGTAMTLSLLSLMHVNVVAVSPFARPRVSNQSCVSCMLSQQTE